MDILLSIIMGVLVAETAGYFVHRLLHSNKVEFLSKSHMIHHLVQYGPKTGLRSEHYRSPIIDKRLSLFGIGIEWWIPVTVLYGVFAIIFFLLAIPWHLFGTFSLAVGVWGFFFYNYMHDAMHLEHFWMIRNRWLSKFFLKARQLHDIHHLDITDDGRMDKNFGICFFLHDQIFQTFQDKFHQFNENGYQKAKKRYAYIYSLLEKKEHLYHPEKTES